MGQFISTGQQCIADSSAFWFPSMQRRFGESWFTRKEISVDTCRRLLRETHANLEVTRFALYLLHICMYVCMYLCMYVCVYFRFYSCGYFYLSNCVKPSVWKEADCTQIALCTFSPSQYNVLYSERQRCTFWLFVLVKCQHSLRLVVRPL
jgi:hypothetical protein